MHMRDQRHCYPGPNLASVREVRAMWERILVERSAAEGRTITLRQTGVTVAARVDHGRWLVDCDCGDAALAWPDHGEAACMGCGAVCGVEFPPADVVAKAEAVLAARPGRNRNWRPDTETVGDLQAENLLGGEVPAGFAGIVTPAGRLPAGDLLPEFGGR